MDIEYEILAVLWESSQTRNALLRALRDRLDGAEVDPAGVYPVLQMLADGDFVATIKRDDGVLFVLTPQGSALLAARAAEHEESARAPGGDAACPVARGAHVLRAAAVIIAGLLAWRKFAR